MSKAGVDIGMVAGKKGKARQRTAKSDHIRLCGNALKRGQKKPITLPKITVPHPEEEDE